MRKSRRSPRARLGAIGIIFALAVTGLMVGATSATAVTQQNGPRNYVGPAPCPLDATDCFTWPANTPGPANLVVEQTQTEGDLLGLGRYNRTTCSQSAADNDANGVVDLLCQVTQGRLANGEDDPFDAQNTVTVNMSGSASNASTGHISQDVALRLIVDQLGGVGNTVTGSDPNGGATLAITETANPGFSTTSGVTHDQQSFELARIKQIATGNANNALALTLNRTQTSSTTGIGVFQKQDNEVNPAATEAYCVNPGRNGNACILQESENGTQQVKIRATDRKSATATDVPVTGVGANQLQGPHSDDLVPTNEAGGWLVEVDQNSSLNPRGSTVDLGEACVPGPAEQPPDGTTDCHNTPGVGKWWTVSANGLLGTSVGGLSSQNDGILDNLIGRSPCWGQSTSWTLLQGREAGGADDGTQQKATLDAVGHTKTPAMIAPHSTCANGKAPGWGGSISAQLDDVGKRINFGGTVVSAHIGCEDTVDNSNAGCGAKVETTPVPFSATEGNAAGGNVATFTSDNPSDTTASYSADIDWGDGTIELGGGDISGGSGNFAIAGSHTYADNGPRDLTVTLYRSGKQVGLVSQVVNVANGALAASGTPVSALLGAEFTSPVATFTNGNPTEGASTHTASINWGDGSSSPADGKPVSIVPNETGGFTVNGTHKYAISGSYTIVTTITEEDGATATANSPVTLSVPACAPGGCFVIGKNNTTGTVTFWGQDWSVKNSLVPPAPASFKGFENKLSNNADPSKPPCPATSVKWLTSGGNSPPPSGAIPAGSLMTVIVTGSVSKSGTAISGNIVKLVVVKADAGYAPSPGGTGTGTVVATICG